MPALEAGSLNEVRARLGAALREARIRGALTQEQLAERAGLSYKFIGEIERGQGNPTIETIASLADALQVPIADFFAAPRRDRLQDADYRMSKRDVQLVRDAAVSLGALADQLSSPPYRAKRRKR